MALPPSLASYLAFHFTVRAEAHWVISCSSVTPGTACFRADIPMYTPCLGKSPLVCHLSSTLSLNTSVTGRVGSPFIKPAECSTVQLSSDAMTWGQHQLP